MINIEIVPFDVNKASNNDWQKYHVFRKQRHDESHPNELFASNKELEEKLRIRPTRLEVQRFNVFEKNKLDTQIGEIYFSFYNDGTDKNSAIVNTEILHAFRHHGVGIQLFKKIADLAQEYKKTRILFQSVEEDGIKVIEHVHAIKLSEQEQFRLNIQDANWNIINKWLSDTQQILSKVTIDWINVVDKLPVDILEQYSRIMASSIDEEKRFHIGVTSKSSKEISIETLKEDIKQFTSKGGKWILGIIREKNGDVSGLTELKWSPSRPDVLLQFVTHIKLKYRGTGRGKLLKAQTMNYIKENMKDVKFIHTGFVGPKESALYKINEKIGFKLFFHSESYEMKTNDLEKWVNEHIKQH